MCIFYFSTYATAACVGATRTTPLLCVLLCMFLLTFCRTSGTWRATLTVLSLLPTLSSQLDHSPILEDGNWTGNNGQPPRLSEHGLVNPVALEGLSPILSQTLMEKDSGPFISLSARFFFVSGLHVRCFSSGATGQLHFM